jgi:16S rRNA processing protein RimM
LKFSNSPYHPDELIQLGKIIGAHGIHGAIKVYSYAESFESFTSQRNIIVQDSNGRRMVYDLLMCQPYKQIVRMTLKDITSRDQAEALAGYAVFVTKASLSALEEGSYYWHELIGMAVLTVEGKHLGRLIQIIPTGANDVYVVRTEGGHQAEEILLPAIPSVVIEIDVAQQRMLVRLPEGLT